MWAEGLEVCYLGLLEEAHPTLYNKLNRQDPEQTDNQTKNPQNRTRKQHANQNKSSFVIQPKQDNKHKRNKGTSWNKKQTKQ